MGNHEKLSTGIGGGICGIYSITTPSGKCYIGSSIDVRRRWYEHHWRMKRGKSSSPQLDRAYAKYGLQLKFRLLEECEPDGLRNREQWYLDNYKPDLNASDNAYCAALWAAKKGADLSAGAEARRCPLEDSNGNTYESVTAAAAHLGCSESLLRRRLKHHDPMPCGLRLRRPGEEWQPMRPPAYERKRQGIRASFAKRQAEGGIRHSEAARQEKSNRTKGVPWSAERRARFDAKKMAKQEGRA